MKTRTKVAIAASAAVLLAGIGVAGVSRADSGNWGHHGSKQFYGEHHDRHGMGGGEGWGHGDRERGHQRGRHMMSMFESFDGNGDGALTQAEIDEARATRLARFDADGSGALNLEEYETLWLDAMRERMVDRFQKLDANGDATVTAAEFAEPFAGTVRFMDHNGDGTLSRDDMGHMRDRDGKRDD